MKKKIFMLSLVACLVVLSIAGTSLAYFTDTDSKTNVFTSGNVDIKLEYNESDTRIYPGQTYIKDAIITNIGTEDAFVGIIIDVAVDKTTFSASAIAAIFTVPGNNTVKCVETTNGYAIFAVAGAPVAKAGSAEGTTTTISVKMAIPEEWTSEQTAKFTSNSPVVTVTAYGVQTVGFSTATEALTTAFDAWESYPTTANQ